MPNDSTQSSNNSSGSKHLKNYGLLDALLNRRSRRFSRGMKIESGPTEYSSKQEPYPLTEEEQAILTFAACGITGAALADWSYAEGAGGTMMARSVGRTVSSGDAVHTASLFVIDDNTTWLARRPQDLDPEVLAEVIELTQDEQFVEAWRKMRVKIADERIAPPTESPFNIAGNRWSLYAEGTTFFLPVSSLTYAAINAMLEFLSERNEFFVLDERRMYLPAGLKEFAKSNGGHLDDDPTNGKAMPIALFERMGGEIMAVEQGMILQNLGLACQAMGLSGFPAFAAHEESWFKALGFRMQSMPITEYMAVPFPASTMLKLTGKNPNMSYPVGLEQEGEILLKSYAPPYYPSMEDAVQAVVNDKYRSGGIYGGGEKGVFEHREANAGWQEPDQISSEVPKTNKKAISATVSCLEYIWERYGRFPATYPPFHTLMGFQAGHVDEKFYNKHYRSGSLSDTHRDHMEQWHTYGN